MILRRSSARAILVLFLPLLACAPLAGTLRADPGRRIPDPGSVSADWIARQVRDRDTGRDARSEMTMRLYDRRGRVRERRLVLLSMRGGTGPGRPDGDRLLVRFLHPADIRGTGFLVLERPDGEDERFLYLPALGRVRRIAGAEAQESFVGSDFTYEDIGGRRLDDYTYDLLEEDAVWRAPDGRSHPAWRLESRRRDAGARFPRVVSLVRKDNFVVVHADIFNRRGEPQKRYDVRRLALVHHDGTKVPTPPTKNTKIWPGPGSRIPDPGIWTAMEMTMEDDLDGTRTELVVEKVEYDVGLTGRDFTRRELEAGVR